MLIAGTPFEISNAVFANGFASQGGAIKISQTHYAENKISNTVFKGNHAIEGGAVYILGGGVTFTNCSFKENQASH